MSILIFVLLLSVILVAMNSSTMIALNASDNKPDNNTDLGGLSAESVDIAEENKTKLIENATNSSDTDFGGLSARSVNITN